MVTLKCLSITQSPFFSFDKKFQLVFRYRLFGLPSNIPFHFVFLFFFLHARERKCSISLIFFPPLENFFILIIRWNVPTAHHRYHDVESTRQRVGTIITVLSFLFVFRYLHYPLLRFVNVHHFSKHK